MSHLPNYDWHLCQITLENFKIPSTYYGGLSHFSIFNPNGFLNENPENQELRELKS